MRSRGTSLVSDRDFVMLQGCALLGDGKIYVEASKSIPFEYPIPSGVVRGECFNAGFIVEKKNEKTCKVTYISDGDLKGSIPDFVKRQITETEGEVAGHVNEFLKEWRSKSKK